MKQKQLLKSCHPERSEGPQMDSSRVTKPVQSFFARPESPDCVGVNFRGKLRMTNGSALVS